jgi:hypothetical protein
LSLNLYMDVHVHRAITEGLRIRGIDVMTSQEDGTRRLEDPALMDRATVLGWALFSQDKDMLAEAARRQRGGIPFSGLIYAHQSLGIGRCIRDLELLAIAGTSEEIADRVIFLPL